MDSININQEALQEHNNQQFLKTFKLILRNIWIIIPIVIVALGIAYFYSKYTIPSYNVSSTILIKDNNNSNFNSNAPGVASYINMGLFSSGQNLQNELAILKSFPNIEKTVKNLDLEVVYFEFKNYQYYNIYKASPFKVFIFKDHPQLIGAPFDLVFNSDGSFNLSINKQDATKYNYQTNQKIEDKLDLVLNLRGNVGEVVENQDIKLLITINDENSSFLQKDRKFAFKLTTIQNLTNYYSKNLKFNIPDRLATVIEISMETTSTQLGKDVIDELINVYSETNLEAKNHLANMTIDYIEKQLDEVSSSLNQYEDNLQRFMSKNKTMNVGEQATRLSEQMLDLQNQLAELMTQKRYFDYVKGFNDGSSDETQIIAPTSMGVQDPLLNNLIQELSAAQTQRANLIKNNQERNPIVSRLNIQIKNLKNTVAENIAAAAHTNELSINEMQKRIEQIENEMGKLPGTQMQMGGIERKYKLNDAIYNYLLEKQAEAKITKASNLPDNVIIEPAHLSSFLPVSPNKKLIYFIAFFFGLSIPISVLLIISLFKTTINSQEDIESITNATILGKVFHFNTTRKEKNVFASSPKDKTAETFRTLRTNLNFAMNGSTHHTLLITSCLSGEGKSFNALNIAASFAQMGKKTILLDFDLRNSHPIIKKMDQSKGLSLYLNEEITLNEIIQKTDFENLDIIQSGPVPPNPLDLMEKGITSDFFKFLKQNYEYIIIDTPPLGQVSDALAVIKYADINLIVTRYNVTKKKLLRLVLNELKNKNINNVYIVLNDNKMISEQMGYGYYNK